MTQVKSESVKHSTRLQAVETNTYKAKSTWPVGNAWATGWAEKSQAEQLAKRYCRIWAQAGVRAKAAVFYRDGSLVAEFSNDIP